MRVLQLIDSLHPGGAERMALNYFNALKDRAGKSVLVATREKGLLAKNIKDDPDFYFLGRKSIFDISAIRKLNGIIKSNEIEFVHAHGTSWFLAVLCKLSGSEFKIIWHDHYGNSEFLEKRKLQPLKMLSRYFAGIISVNLQLEKWTKEKLEFNKPLLVLPNFVQIKEEEAKELEGNEDYKLICVANLRPQKDHQTLLRAFDILKQKYSISLYLFGRDFQDTYSKDLKEEFRKRKEVYYYGEVASVFPYLKSADIGVLSSLSEGLPLALIEYGLAGLAVVCTDVGECSEVIGIHGKLIPPGGAESIAKVVTTYLENPEMRKKDASGLNKRVKELYSEAGILKRYLNFFKEL
ncbi:glycosyltransferase [Christiangramia fulva]|uniref:Glycosyltransferase n=1 Tax=Christiangramia fulva TaxID=2126553 RepID=A0A2R3Z0N7_9FLAO|nr:glycosyltransferase family 4 protein [Christiangramia fulva]AVR43814.1 glycosyltransferase [Christiangramia fulva]